MSARLGDDSEGRSYTLPQLAGISGIDYRTLHNWQKRGTLRASRQAANGSGTVSLFDEADALQVLILAELRRSGIEMRVIEVIAGRVWELTQAIEDHELLVISKDSVGLSSDAELGGRVTAEGPSVVLRVGPVLRALDELPRAA